MIENPHKKKMEVSKKPYQMYINNFDYAMQVRSKAMKNNTSFKEFSEKTRKNPDLQQLDLMSLLIMPVQRIPRYILLLEQLMSKVGKDHPDFSKLSEALTALKEAASEINQKKKASENQMKANTCISNIVGLDKLDFFSSSQREYIMEGNLLCYDDKKGVFVVTTLKRIFKEKEVFIRVYSYFLMYYY